MTTAAHGSPSAPTVFRSGFSQVTPASVVPGPRFGFCSSDQWPSEVSSYAPRSARHSTEPLSQVASRTAYGI